jgi:transmembrane sensor
MESIDSQVPREPSRSDIDAVDWLMRFTELAHSEDATQKREQIQDEFNRWATHSPSNLRSFLEAASMFEALGACEAELIPELVDGIESGEHADTAVRTPPEMVESFARPFPADEHGRSFGFRRASQMAAAMGMIFLIGVFLWRRVGVETFRSSSGERTPPIRLADGSVAFLNEDSEIQVAYSTTRRYIILVRGEALLDVAPDLRRPFVVHSGSTDVDALGTRFDVYRRGGTTGVAVVEGSVRVRLASTAVAPTMSLQVHSGKRQLTLQAGELAQSNDLEVIKVDQAKVAELVHWHSTEMVVTHEPLSEVIDRFNRDNRRQLQIVDPATLQRKITGRFNTDQPEALLESLRHLYPDLSVRKTDDGWVLETTPATSAR